MKRIVLTFALITSSIILKAQITDTGGNVGIGTTTPSSKLQTVVNNTGLNFVSTYINKSGIETGGNAVGIGFLNEGAAGAGWFKSGIVHERLGGYGIGTLHFLVNNSISPTATTLADAKISITSNGNVGIGTKNPAAKLVIQNKDNQGLNVLIDKALKGTWPAVEEKKTVTLQSSGVHVGNLAFANGNSETMRINTLGNVGIGTTTPNAKLDVNGSIILKDGNNLSWGNKYGENIPTIASSIAAGIYFYPSGSTLGATMRIDKSGNVGVGTTTIPSNYKLAIAGKTITEEVKVQLKINWPDYVFSKEYELPTLKEVEKHIEEKGHLPNIPSANEVKENKGIELGKMNTKLLQKIEELTLYTIQQEKEIEILKNQKLEVEKVREENKDLKNRLEKLEKLVNKLL